ncbi:unnamed protein product [Euphydryas editha]|uniref:Uncharacterized protein n=1 Tax=Euphydryas editha TaxID=104508 RepID=A0AAU9TWU7_EUPED|nr:unnamed protein product [Euphydryas editha]
MQPIIDYGDACSTDINEGLLTKLQRLLNTCVRLIYGLRKYDHFTSHRCKVQWTPIATCATRCYLRFIFSPFP